MARLHAVPTTPLRAVLYLRQSTFKEESISLDLQETAGRDYCARMGYDVVKVEADPGISGRTWKRPAVVRVMELIESKQAEVIVLWRWSRLSRNRKDWALAVDRVDIAGGRVESATEPNDVTAAGRFARGVMTELAAFESERIGEQWKEVHENRVARGLQSGRLPWGWMADNKAGIPHPDQASAIPQLYEMYLSGNGGRLMASWLERNGYLTFYGKRVWNNSTVCAILDSPFHSGQVVYRGELFPGSQTPLVSVDTYARYMAMREVRKTERAPRAAYLLSGFLICQCGKKMFGFSQTRNLNTGYTFTSYKCQSARSTPEHGPASVSTRQIEGIVLAWLHTVATMEDPGPGGNFQSDQLEAQRFSREIIAIDAQVQQLTVHLASGIVPERAYRSTVAGLEERREALSAQLKAVESRAVLAPADPAGAARGLIDEWETVPLLTKREVIRSLVESLTIEYGPVRRLVILPRGGKPVASDL